MSPWKERGFFALPRESPHPVPLPQGERGLCMTASRQIDAAPHDPFQPRSLPCPQRQSAGGPPTLYAAAARARLALLGGAAGEEPGVSRAVGADLVGRCAVAGGLSA